MRQRIFLRPMIAASRSGNFEPEVIMHPTLFMLATLAIGTLFLMLGILVCREPGQSVPATVRSCLAWGTGYFCAMCLQVVVLAHI